MNNLTILALSKLVKEDEYKDASKATEPGTYEIDKIIHLTGTITKGADFEQNMVAKADPWKLLAVTLSHLRDTSIEKIVKESELILESDTLNIKESAKKAIEAIKKSTKQTMTGKVTSNLDYKIVKIKEN